MGLFRLISRIGRMIFRDFLFKIPKKYLVLIIVFLTMFLIKTNVFAYDMGQPPIKNKTDITTHVPYASILEFYEYYPLFDGTWQNIEYGNNGDVYMLDTNLEFYNDDIDKVVLKGQMYIPRYSNQTWHSSIIASSYKASPSINFYKYSWGMDADTGGWFKNRFYLNSTSYNLDVPILLSPNTANFIFTGLSNGNISGYINNTAFSKTFIEPNTNTNYLHNISTFRFNYSEVSNGTIRFSNFKTYNTNNEVSHDFYPVKANLNGVIYYGFYDIYAGNFYRLEGVNLQLSSFGNVLTGTDVPPNMNNFNISPNITNSTSDIETWSFENLEIAGGSLLNTNNGTDTDFILRQEYNNSIINLNLSNYKIVNGVTGGVNFSIPRSELLSGNSIVNGRSVTFSLYVVEHSPTHATTYVLDTYTLNLTSTEQGNINEDRTQQELTNISNEQQQTTNSINNMSNFLSNDSIDNSVIDIDSPDISNTEVASVGDSGFNDIFDVFTDNLSNNNVASVDIYIPNYLTGGGTKFITIRGDLISNALSQTSIIPGTDFTILYLIQVIWTALFGYWFLIIITSFVNMIYSGSIINDNNLQKLTSTYTGVTGSML